MGELIRQSVLQLVNRYDVSEQFVRHYIYLSLIVAFALICGLIFKKAIVPILKRIIEKTPFKFDDYFFSENTFKTFSHLIPAIIISVFLPLCYIGKETTSWMYILVSRALNIYIIVLIAHLIGEILSNILRFSKSSYSDGYNHYFETIVQFLKLIVYFFAGIVIIAVTINRNPTTLLAGLGAMATILLLVFQDTILGFVAGIQLNINKMLEVGDWIEVKGKDINGYVVKVNLTTIKIRNFDNSIATIPPYKLVSETFKNWKGIQEFKCRQVRRVLNLDMTTVHFVDENELTNLMSMGILNKNIEVLDIPRITNAGLFRKQIESYLKEASFVNHEGWLMVRQMDSSMYGLTIELYFYIKETDFVKYEEIVAEVYEYCIATAPLFGLKMYQGMTYK